MAFGRELGRQVAGGDLFFWAGAITFNVLVAVVPLLLLVAGLAGYFLSARFGRVTPELLALVFAYLPAVGGDVELAETVGRFLEGLIDERTGFSLLGALVLLWISTRLVSSVRVVLREVFELEWDRGPVRGKLFDVHVVLLGAVLLLLNLGITAGWRAVRTFGLDLLGVDPEARALFLTATTYGLSLAAAWVLFFLLYWYVPARRIPFRTAVVGATFTAVVFQILSLAFAWYATAVADYSTAYGSLAVVAILFFWIYYSAVVFVLGGHVARTYEIRREAKMAAREDGARSSLGGGRPGSGAGGAALSLVLLLALPTVGVAQSVHPFGGTNGNGNGNAGLLNGGDGVVYASSFLERELSLDRPLVDHDGPYIVVHLAENRVLVLDGPDVVWSAPAGTGHGVQLSGQGRDWTFTTPIGLFHVRRMEKDPVWLAPDWYYVQRGAPIPASSSDRYRIEGTLGTTALFLGDGIAIHGTDQPELLMMTNPDDRRVSHGCIRLTNEAARELMHQVEVGTPVLIF